MIDTLSLLGRSSTLFESDVREHEKLLRDAVSQSRFLVIGGAGTIGQAVTREIFSRNPSALHVVDLSENNLVELVREIRSSLGYGDGDFRTFALDCAGAEFEMLLTAEGPYDYVCNLSALKHVRSEKDPYTLMRLIQVNIINTLSTMRLAREAGLRKYFCVSTDKAANPVNMMGASKRIMELFITHESRSTDISTARFANVAFSDGSLLHGFNQRFLRQQPFSAPTDVRRYFLTPSESGELCLLSTIFGASRDIFFPQLREELQLIAFPEIATRYLRFHGFEPYECGSEEEARRSAKALIAEKRWPVHFFTSDTTGEKEAEEFYTDDEELDLERFKSIGIVKNAAETAPEALAEFLVEIEKLRASRTWDKATLVNLFRLLLPEFKHHETGRYLDERM